MKIKIIVATHKEYNIPQNRMYLPLFCGAKLSSSNLPYQRDDEGENISAKNKYYCELTGLYWAWKNLNVDYIGLNHYRRYFKCYGHILTKEDAEQLLSEYDVILPKKRYYYIETIYSQYVHAHGKESIDKVKEIITQYYPEYLQSFNICMKKRSLHLYNMFVMKKDIFDEYCKFLFEILKLVEEKIEVEERMLGFIGERLIDVFLYKKNIFVIELPVVNKEHINWISKIYHFVKRKIVIH